MIDGSEKRKRSSWLSNFRIRMLLKSAEIAKDNEYSFKELDKFCHIGL